MVYTKEGIEIGLKKFNQSQNESDGLVNNIEETTYYEIFTNLKYKKMARIGFFSGFLQPLSGIFTAILASTSIYEDSGSDQFMSRLYTFLISIVFLIASLFANLLTEKYRRKPLIISGQLLIALDMLFLGIITSTSDDYTGSVITGIVLLYVFYSYSLGCTL